MTEQECAELKAKVLKQIAALPDAPWRVMDVTYSSTKERRGG